MVTHFGIDQTAANVIVSHLLSKNENFVCLKRDLVIDHLYPERRPYPELPLLQKIMNTEYNEGM